jgi:hypothetical protein
MVGHALNWIGVIGMPILAGSFALNIYRGEPADWCVWSFAFYGVIHTFLYYLEKVMVAA